MKKVLALVLSLVIVISGLTTTLFSGVSATVSGNDVFNTSANWVVYAFDTTHFNGENGTAGPSFTSVSENTNTAYTCDDESSLKIGSKVQYATVEFDVEQNKYYELSYKFLANGTPYTSTLTGKSAYLWSTGVTTSDANITGGKNYYAHMSTTANYTAENGVYDSRINGTEYTDQWITAGIWNTVTLKFNSGSATKMVLAIQPGADSFYVDDFTLTETAPEYTYDDAAAWGVYHARGAATLNGAGTQTYSWGSITDNTDKTYTYNNGEKSVKYYGNGFFMATKLKDLVKDKAYKITFKYFAPTTSQMGAVSKAWCSELGIYAGGTAMNGDVPASAVKKGNKIAGESGKWNEFSMSFKADSTDLYFGIHCGFAKGYVLYIDEFTVTEKTDGGSSEPGTDKTPKESVVIDFDTYGGNAVQTSPRVKIEDCTAYNGSTSKMLHFIGGDYSSSYATNLNYSTIMASGAQDTDDVFTVGVKPNTKYTLSFRSKVSDSTEFDATYLKAFFTYKGVVKKDFDLTKDVKGAWVEHTVEYTTEADQNLLSFYMNLSKVHVDVWVDDITIAEKKDTPDPDPTPVIPGKEPKDETVINFDTPETGANASLTPSSRIEIAEGTAYDGSKSKMLHFKKGQYTLATTLNYGTGYQSDSDDVFTVGVKPNSVYKLTYRIKIDSNKEFTPEWLGFYATYNKEMLAMAYFHSGSKFDEWLLYECTLTTGASQNLLSFYANMGKNTPDIWIDDITLTKTDMTPFNGWGDTPKEEYNINFDDFDVVYDNSAIEIIDGPAKEDGSVSKATHIKAGSYKNAVFSNWSTVTTGKDKVFTIPVKPNTLYEFGYSLYTDEKEGKIAYFTFFYDYENTLALGASGDATKKKWVHRTARFVTKPDQTQISIGFNAGETVLNLFLDDVYLKEILPGTVGYANDLSYCENPYNIVKQQGLQKKVTSGKSAVIKLPVKEQTMYTFGITVNSSKMSNSKIFLSTDGVTPMAKSMDNAPTAIISADGKSGRYGINFVSDNTGYVYLVIQNDDGALTLKDPMLFNTVSISTGLPIGRKTMQKTELSVNKNVKLENIKLLGEEDGKSNGSTNSSEETLDNSNSDAADNNTADYTDYGDNPTTGSETVLPAIMLFITLALALIVLAKFKKGGEQA